MGNSGQPLCGGVLVRVLLGAQLQYFSHKAREPSPFKQTGVKLAFLNCPLQASWKFSTGSANHRLETIGSAEPEISVSPPCKASSVLSAMLAPQTA